MLRANLRPLEARTLETPSTFCFWPFREGQTAWDTHSNPKSGAPKAWDIQHFLLLAFPGRPNGVRHPLNPKIRGAKSVRHPAYFAHDPFGWPNGVRHPLTLFGPYINRVTKGGWAGRGAGGVDGSHAATVLYFIFAQTGWGSIPPTPRRIHYFIIVYYYLPLFGIIIYNYDYYLFLLIIIYHHLLSLFIITRYCLLLLILIY